MILLALLVLSIPVCAIAGLVLGLSARTKLENLQQRIAASRRCSWPELGPASRLPFRQRKPRLPPRPRHRSRSPTVGRTAPAGRLRSDCPGHNPAAGSSTPGFRGEARGPLGRLDRRRGAGARRDLPRALFHRAEPAQPRDPHRAWGPLRPRPDRRRRMAAPARAGCRPAEASPGERARDPHRSRNLQRLRLGLCILRALRSDRPGDDLRPARPHRDPHHGCVDAAWPDPGRTRPARRHGKPAPRLLGQTAALGAGDLSRLRGPARLWGRAPSPVALARPCGRDRRPGLDLPHLHPRQNRCPAGDGASRRPGRACRLLPGRRPLPGRRRQRCGNRLGGQRRSVRLRPRRHRDLRLRDRRRRPSGLHRRFGPDPADDRPALRAGGAGGSLGGTDGRRSPSRLADPRRDRRSARTSFLPERRCLRRPAPCALGLSRPRGTGTRRHRRLVAASPREQASSAPADRRLVCGRRDRWAAAGPHRRLLAGGGAGAQPVLRPGRRRPRPRLHGSLPLARPPGVRGGGRPAACARRDGLGGLGGSRPRPDLRPRQGHAHGRLRPHCARHGLGRGKGRHPRPALRRGRHRPAHPRDG